ncbi:hypothetical protein [Novosphingobium resinovorum]|uniref:hypothetical protein n=1 Tax=Novosphingobium resinovorum TaxID=158500 RepID=UPI002ED598EF|nr:hypothetical protein [Novosphingobium resinovorum]
MIHTTIVPAITDTPAQAARRAFNRDTVGIDASEGRGLKARHRLNLLVFGADTTARLTKRDQQEELTASHAIDRIRQLNSEDLAGCSREAFRRRAAGLPQFARN